MVAAAVTAAAVAAAADAATDGRKDVIWLPASLLTITSTYFSFAETWKVVSVQHIVVALFDLPQVSSSV